MTEREKKMLRRVIFEQKVSWKESIDLFCCVESKIRIDYIYCWALPEHFGVNWEKFRGCAGDNESEQKQSIFCMLAIMT